MQRVLPLLALILLFIPHPPALASPTPRFTPLTPLWIGSRSPASLVAAPLHTSLTLGETSRGQIKVGLGFTTQGLIIWGTFTHKVINYGPHSGYLGDGLIIFYRTSDGSFEQVISLNFESPKRASLERLYLNGKLVREGAKLLPGSSAALRLLTAGRLRFAALIPYAELPALFPREGFPQLNLVLTTRTSEGPQRTYLVESPGFDLGEPLRGITLDTSLLSTHRVLLMDRWVLPEGIKVEGYLGGINRPSSIKVRGNVETAVDQVEVGRFSLTAQGGSVVEISAGPNRWEVKVVPRPSIKLPASSRHFDQELSFARNMLEARFHSLRVVGEITELTFLANNLSGWRKAEEDGLTPPDQVLWGAIVSDFDGAFVPYVIYSPPVTPLEELPRRPLLVTFHPLGDNEWSLLRSNEFIDHCRQQGFYCVGTNGRGLANYRRFASQDVLSLIRRLQEKLPIDQTQVMGLGVSSGGEALYLFAERNPDLFSALTVVSAPILFDPGWDDPVARRLSFINNPASFLGNLSNLSILILHGDKDPLVPIEQAKEAYRVLKEADANVTLTVVDGGGHADFLPRLLDKIFSFLSEAPPRLMPPKRIVLRSYGFPISAYGFTLLAPRESDFFFWAKLTLEGTRLRIQTSNVGALSIDSPLLAKRGAIAVEIDGQTIGPRLFPQPATFAREDFIRLHSPREPSRPVPAPGKWEEVEKLEFPILGKAGTFGPAGAVFELAPLAFVARGLSSPGREFVGRFVARLNRLTHSQFKLRGDLPNGDFAGGVVEFVEGDPPVVPPDRALRRGRLAAYLSLVPTDPYQPSRRLVIGVTDPIYWKMLQLDPLSLVRWDGHPDFTFWREVDGQLEVAARGFFTDEWSYREPVDRVPGIVYGEGD